MGKSLTSVSRGSGSLFVSAPFPPFPDPGGDRSEAIRTTNKGQEVDIQSRTMLGRLSVDVIAHGSLFLDIEEWMAPRVQNKVET